MSAKRAKRQTVPVPKLANVVSGSWRQLATGVSRGGRYDPMTVSSQPEALRRWLGQALLPGTPLGGAVQLSMSGQIRLNGRWRPFVAEQISTPDGYIWAATVRAAGLRITGFDRYLDGNGELRWKLLSLVPVVSASGTDVSTSAAGRLAAEIALNPTAFGRAAWEATADPEVVIGTFSFPHGDERVALRIDSDGRVISTSMLRWGNPDGEAFGRFPFGAELSETATFDGVTIPTKLRVGWGWGTDRWEHGEFFRAKISHLSLLG
jgi:hypothetical protein